MKRYVDKFISQEIDMDTLPLLTESHLEQLGIPTMGARLRILAAIKELKCNSLNSRKVFIIKQTQIYIYSIR